MQAFRASDTGQMNVNAMYTDIAASIAGSPSIQPDEIDAKMNDLVAKLRALSQRSVTYAQFGLMSRLPVEQPSCDGEADPAADAGDHVQRHQPVRREH